ncbi:alpha/beta fold hydrolase [Sphingomonas naphthae]|uniref:Alpha/beta fold hydrolase n=1 Tax=Sphingomonas naphthae TaxID=1813468 RepID=A0ABY7TGF8_9SPHN|nr:alpha/beta fold hydrolase [Sphingomonas naphthae]WCT72245.1 alpha/beta fold hydrolase [Sphingomonas naphthae]
MPSEAGVAPSPKACTLNVPDFRFADGTALANLHLSYWTMGTLAPGRDNAMLLCHGASGGKDWALPYCQPGGAFDPDRHFLISIDMPGGGGSSRRGSDPAFPAEYAIGDMGTAVVALLDALGIEQARGFAGASMASLIGIDLAYRYPDRIGALALWTGAHRSDGFVRGVADALRGVLALDQTPAGFRAAAAAFLPALYGRRTVAEMAAADVAALLDMIAAQWAQSWRADELSARYRAVGHCDLARVHGGIDQLATGIRCPLLFLQSTSDQVFDLAEVERFVGQVPFATLKVIETGMGHLAPFAPPGSAEFTFFDQNTARFWQDTAPC